MTTYTPIQFTGPVGRSIVRTSGREKVTGTATFTTEWPIENLLYAVAVPSTIAHGKIVSIDTDAALKMAGVRAMLTPDNVPSFIRVKSGAETNFATSISSILYPAAEQEVFYAGQYVAAAIAESFEAARDAALAVKVVYEPLPHNTNIDVWAQSERPKNLQGEPAVIEIKDADAELKASPVVVDNQYPLMGNHHNPIEPHAAIAIWSSKDDKPFLTVYETSQSVAIARLSYAKVFNLNPKQVRVVCKYIGGAFGSKGLMWPHALLACFCAKLTGQPVKVVVSREQMYGGTGHRTPIRQRVAIGADRDGTIRAIIHSGNATTAVRDTYEEAFTMATRMMYQTTALRLDQTQTRINTQLPTFMRAPAETPGMFALESAIDELAVKLKLDPIELRIKNEPANDVHNDKPFSGRLLVQCLQQGAKQFGWATRNPTPRSQRDGHWLIGQGVAAATYPALTMPTTVRLSLRSDGTAHIDCCTQEMGTGTATAQSQLLADLLGIPAERVSMTLGDSDLPAGGVSGGSATTASVGGAIRDAIENLKQRVIELAPADSFVKSATKVQLKFREGRITHDASSISFTDFLAATKQEVVTSEGKIGMSMGGPTSNHSFGAQFVEVAVDEDFGAVRLRRMLGCFACGTILNRRTGRSQFLGAMIMGIGHALQEATHWDHRLGRITNDSLAEYLVPVNADIPDIEVMWIDEPDFNASAIGAKGIGEIGITGVAAAVANAIYHATGKRIRSLPITPEKVMA